MSQTSESTINLMEHFVLNKKGTRIDWKATTNSVRRWYLDHPSNSTAADALSVGEHIKVMKKHVKKVGILGFIPYLKNNKLVK